MNTPWGDSVHCEDIGNGVLLVETEGHGGYFVPEHMLHKIPLKLRQAAKEYSGNDQWYEEDCEWACVAMSMPELFSEKAVESAREILSSLQMDHYFHAND